MSGIQLPVGVLNGKHRELVVPNAEISLRPIHPTHLPLIWGWMNEFPRANFDDYGPQSIEAFKAQIISQIERREVLVVAHFEDRPVGIICYSPITDRLGSMHGICFSKEVHGKGVAAFAVHRFLEKLFTGTNLQKIQAAYFQDNIRIKKFLRAQGFAHEGTLMEHAMRGGKPVNVTLVALLRRNFGRAIQGEVQ